MRNMSMAEFHYMLIAVQGDDVASWHTVAKWSMDLPGS
jgi:hypothetical protein